MSDVRCQMSRDLAAPSRPSSQSQTRRSSGVRYQTAISLSKRGTVMYERPATPEPHLELQSNSQGAPQAFPTSDIWLP